MTFTWLPPWPTQTTLLHMTRTQSHSRMPCSSTSTCGLSNWKLGIPFVLMISINACAIDSSRTLLPQNNKVPQKPALAYICVRIHKAVFPQRDRVIIHLSSSALNFALPFPFTCCCLTWTLLFGGTYGCKIIHCLPFPLMQRTVWSIAGIYMAWVYLCSGYCCWRMRS